MELNSLKELLLLDLVVGYLELLLVVGVLLNYRVVQYLLASKSQGWLDLQHGPDNLCQIFRVFGWNRIIASFLDFAKQLLHLRCSEGRLEAGHLVKHAAQRPSLGLSITICRFSCRMVRRARPLDLHSLGSFIEIQGVPVCV